ncbi:MAG TPA: GYD domain-containing protein [bacterium]|nr:GYD domain-containing protein [bacterium]
MPKYLWTGSYTAEGARGVLKEGGAGRRAAVQQLVESAGGKLESFYYAFGGSDFFITIDLPNNAAAANAAMRVAASGAARVRTIVLVAPEDIDHGGRSVKYRAPGQ